VNGPTVALAVSGHGFGHAVRSAEVARALLQRGARVMLRTDAPRWLFPAEVECLPAPGWPLDVGVAQHDGLDLDVDETRRRWRSFAKHFQDHASSEADLLGEQRVDVVLGDVPPLAFAAAAQAGIPNVALANFGWDWIYSAWPDFDQPVAYVQAGYACADLLFRLPLHSATPEAFPAFTTIDDVPLIARVAQRSRADVRREIGLPDDARAVLLSFGGFTAHGLDVEALGARPDYTFVLTPPLSRNGPDLPKNVLSLGEQPADYVSLLGACDVVVTKPGYGIVADCLANRVAVLFTDRGPFREYDVLAEALPTLGRARYIPRADLLAGRLGQHLDALLQTPARWTEQPMNGAEVVAERLLALDL
jgi:UDP:flavonoid glycosyltransferase YjiC (YdhE family)